jgi:hypothetical protein
MTVYLQRDHYNPKSDDDIGKTSCTYVKIRMNNIRGDAYVQSKSLLLLVVSKAMALEAKI